MSAVSKMENPQEFRILGLPYVAFKEVLCMWSPFELINFSLINSKTKRITKSVTKRFSKKHELTFTFADDLTLWIDEPCDGYCYRMTNDKSESEQVMTDYENNKICLKFSEDSLNGFMKWSEYVMQILNFRIHSIGFFVDQMADEIIPIIDWLKNLTSELDTCHIEGKKESDDVLHHILNNFEITDYMYIDVPTTENFTSKLPKTSDSLLIEPSKWVTLQQLLELDCEEINIRSSSLSNQELAVFVTSWMAMESNLNLCRFETDIQKDADFDEIVGGLPEERLFFGAHEALEKRFQRPMDGSWTLTRTDGKQAVLYTFLSSDELFLYFITF